MNAPSSSGAMGRSRSCTAKAPATASSTRCSPEHRSRSGHLATGYASLKLLQALAMSLVAVPVFFYGRRLMRPGYALLAAALALASPLTLYSGLIMTEVLIYPIGAFALLAIARAVETATLRHQADRVRGDRRCAADARPVDRPGRDLRRRDRRRLAARTRAAVAARLLARLGFARGRGSRGRRSARALRRIRRDAARELPRALIGDAGRRAFQLSRALDRGRPRRRARAAARRRDAEQGARPGSPGSRLGRNLRDDPRRRAGRLLRRPVRAPSARSRSRAAAALPLRRLRALARSRRATPAARRLLRRPLDARTAPVDAVEPPHEHQCAARHVRRRHPLPPRFATCLLVRRSGLAHHPGGDRRTASPLHRSGPRPHVRPADRFDRRRVERHRQARGLRPAQPRRRAAELDHARRRRRRSRTSTTTSRTGTASGRCDSGTGTSPTSSRSRPPACRGRCRSGSSMFPRPAGSRSRIATSSRATRTPSSARPSRT